MWSMEIVRKTVKKIMKDEKKYFGKKRMEEKSFKFYFFIK